MKKTITLFTLLLIAKISSAQMIVHGASITRFYYVDELGQLYNVIFEEVYVSHDDSGAFNGVFLWSGDVTANPLTDLLPEDQDDPWPTERISCVNARWAYGKANVSCLPWYQLGEGFLNGYCGNNASLDACSIKQGTVTQIVPDGNFKF